MKQNIRYYLFFIAVFSMTLSGCIASVQATWTTIGKSGHNDVNLSNPNANRYYFRNYDRWAEIQGNVTVINNWQEIYVWDMVYDPFLKEYVPAVVDTYYENWNELDTNPNGIFTDSGAWVSLYSSDENTILIQGTSNRYMYTIHGKFKWTSWFNSYYCDLYQYIYFYTYDNENSIESPSDIQYIDS